MFIPEYLLANHQRATFYSLLDIGYDEAFQCRDCGPVPSQVVFDGTALGLQKTFMPLPTNCTGSDSTADVLDGR